MSTPAENAATVREALVGKGPIESWADREEAALAALDKDTA